MTDLHVQIPDEISVRFATEAAERGISAEEVAAEVLMLHAPLPRDRSLSFVGIGQAKPGCSARIAEQRLEAEGFA